MAMSGYAVAGRVEMRGPRFIADASPACDGPERSPDAPDVRPDLVAPHDTAVIGERWEAFRDRWSQLTFFLFDGNSWRT